MPLTPTQIDNAVRAAVQDAIDFVDSTVKPDRMKAVRYFNGGVSIGHTEGRSKVVATKVRDTIRALKPGIMRLFMQSGKPAEFIPSKPQDVPGAEQATNYARYVFDRNDGFAVLHDAIHDALLKKVGVVKVFYDETVDVEVDEYTGATPELIALIQQDPEISDVEAEAQEDGSFSIRVSRESRRGKIRMTGIAPEDFFVDGDATSVADCFVCGHSSIGRVSDLVALGFPLAEVLELASDDGAEEEDQDRHGNTLTSDPVEDPSMRRVRITEAYMRIDIEGTGRARKYKFICAGDEHKVLDYEPCDYNPFAIFEIDPEPHAFFGRSIADILFEDQDAATSLLRGLLDSIAMANTPRAWAVADQVNMDDLLNNEIGGVVRVKSPNAIGEFSIGNAASAALPAIQFFDETIRGKTGVIGAGMGLDAEALQSQTAAGVRLADQTSNATADLIARTLAEGGLKQMFQTIVTLARQHPNPDEMMRVDGQFTPVDPSSWGTEMDLQVNVGLGTGRNEERMMALQQTLQTQMGIYQSYGPNNGLVTLTNLRATLTDILRLSGVHNADRYFAPMDPQREQMLMQQAAQAAQGQQQGSDPNMAFLQAEQMKAQAKAHGDAMRLQADMQKAAMQDDRERDRMAQDLAIEAARLASKPVNVPQVQRMQAMPRV